MPAGSGDLERALLLAFDLAKNRRIEVLITEISLGCHGSKLNQRAKVEMTQQVEPA
jgi:hypothetical protein